MATLSARSTVPCIPRKAARSSRSAHKTIDALCKRRYHKMQNTSEVKQMKKVPAILLAAAMLLLCLFSCSFAEEKDVLVSGNYRYRLQEDGTALLLEYTGEGDYLEIPAQLGGAALTVIGPNAFKSCNSLVYVDIPSSVTEVGDYAFFYCRNLSIVNLPDSIRTIGRNPFAACESLSTINISKNHPSLSLQDGVLFSLEDSRLVFYSMMLPKGPYDVP